MPDGLTTADYAWIAETIAAGRAASTRKTYASLWRRFERWCAGRGITAMPAIPAIVCADLTDLATLGFAAGTIEGACAAIGAAHETEGHGNPMTDPTVKAVRRGIRRTLGTAPRRQSRPLNTAEIRQILDYMDRTDTRGIRDAAIILLSFASALRRSEQFLGHSLGGSRLRATDVDEQALGLTICGVHRFRSSQDEAKGGLHPMRIRSLQS